MKWTSSYSEQIMCYTNNIFQKDGGTHLSGFKSALTRTINNFVLKIMVSRNMKYLVMTAVKG